MISRVRILIVALLAMALVGVVAAQEDPEGPTLETITGTEDYYGQTVTVEGVVREFVGSRIFVLAEGVTLDDDAVLVINMGPEIDMSVVKSTRLQVTGTVQPSLQYITDNELSAPVFTPADDIDVDNVDTDIDSDVDAVVDTDVEPTMEADADMEPTAEGEMEATVEGEPTMEGDMEATPEGEPTEEMDMEATPETDTSVDTGMSIPDVVNFYYAGNLPDDFDSYTILIIQSTSDLTIVPEDTE